MPRRRSRGQPQHPVEQGPRAWPAAGPGGAMRVLTTVCPRCR